MPKASDENWTNILVDASCFLTALNTLSSILNNFLSFDANTIL